ncbi:hypothetical protein CNR22_23055 [Sphingobacteriaceae bacterium]|nr:hypothetical protein CNR22_23055 [Sphingobacteriaceae bacterium]
MVTEINNVLSGLNWPKDSLVTLHRLKLGSSFTENTLLKKIISLIGSRNSSRLNRLNENSKIDRPLTAEMRFYLFFLVLNLNFDSHSGKINSDLEKMIASLKRILHIEEAVYQDLLVFLSCNKLYADTKESIYLSPARTNPLLKAKGVNIHFKNKDQNRIQYMKYFNTYDLFLTKTFYSARPYNTFEDEIKIEEINVVSEKQCVVSDYGMFSFDELKHEIRNFHPLQHVQVYGNDYLPSIQLDPYKSEISISGSSAPLSVTSYFEPILEWVNIFNWYGKKHLRIYLKFDYFNTYTTRFLVDLVALCKTFSIHGKEIIFFWYYDLEDVDSKDFGEYLQSHFSQQSTFHLLENDNTVYK